MKRTKGRRGVEGAAKTKQDTGFVKAVYAKRAARYDFTTRFFAVVGWRPNAYRRPAVEALGLQKGARVVDLCCGTGLNFPFLEEKIGATGKITGVDLSAEMLERAALTVRKRGWKNVELANENALRFAFPRPLDAIITSYAITLIPEYDRIIADGARALKPGGRFAVLDFKLPERMPNWLVRLLLSLFIKPFGGSLEMADRRPWRSLAKHLSLQSMREFYFGSTYLAVGEKRRGRAPGRRPPGRRGKEARR